MGFLKKKKSSKKKEDMVGGGEGKKKKKTNRKKKKKKKKKKNIHTDISTYRLGAGLFKRVNRRPEEHMSCSKLTQSFFGELPTNRVPHLDGTLLNCFNTRSHVDLSRVSLSVRGLVLRKIRGPPDK